MFSERKLIIFDLKRSFELKFKIVLKIKEYKKSRNIENNYIFSTYKTTKVSLSYSHWTFSLKEMMILSFEIIFVDIIGFAHNPNFEAIKTIGSAKEF